MLLSFRFTITLVVILFMVITCVIMRFGIVEMYFSQVIGRYTQDLEEEGKYIAYQLKIADYIESPSEEYLNYILEEFLREYEASVIVLNSQLTVVEDTDNQLTGLYEANDQIRQCLNWISFKEYSGKQKQVQIAEPIGDASEGSVEGVVIITASTKELESERDELEYKADLMLIIVMLLGTVSATICVHYLTRPFYRLSKEMQDITLGYEIKHLEGETFLETREIASSVGKMLARLKLLDQSREEFVSNVSHELKTPLTSVKVLADSLLAQEDVPQELYREFLEDIANEIERENSIINDLLSLVKMNRTTQDLNIQSVNMNEMLEAILKRLRPIATYKNTEVIMESERPVIVELDEVKMTLAYTNLVENAIKYNKPGGYVHVKLDADHQYCYVNVEDSGIGIPQKEYEQIFERFYRVDKSHSNEIGGTGLGLAIVRSAILLHRGEIEVDSTEGEGTVFRVKIPLTFVR